MQSKLFSDFCLEFSGGLAALKKGSQVFVYHDTCQPVYGDVDASGETTVKRVAKKILTLTITGGKRKLGESHRVIPVRIDEVHDAFLDLRGCYEKRAITAEGKMVRGGPFLEQDLDGFVPGAKGDAYVLLTSVSGLGAPSLWMHDRGEYMFL